jgi:sec-independent protein translocase protein TatB
MLDIGFPEFLLISFVLLIVVGPKDFPKVLRSITTFIRKIKTMASQFHSGIDDLANESEISDLRKEVSKIENNPILDSEINEIKDLKNEINVKSLKDNVNEIKNSQNTSVKPKKTSKTIKK